MRKGGFADRVRQAARKLQARAGSGSFPASDLGHEAGIGTRADMKHLWWTIQDLVKGGELVRLERGVYRYVGKPAADRRPEKRAVMWRFLRMAKTVTVQDLVEASGASEAYAAEWLRLLVSRGVVRRHANGNYRLIADCSGMPENMEKAEKLKKIRERKRWQMRAAIEEARDALNMLERMVLDDGNEGAGAGQGASGV